MFGWCRPPRRPDLDHAERIGRLRTLRAITHLSLGPRGEPLARGLQRAERDDVALEYVLFALNGPALLDRRVLASYVGGPARDGALAAFQPPLRSFIRTRRFKIASNLGSLRHAIQ